MIRLPCQNVKKTTYIIEKMNLLQNLIVYQNQKATRRIDGTGLTFHRLCGIIIMIHFTSYIVLMRKERRSDTHDSK